MCDREIISDEALECGLVSLGKGFKPLPFEVYYLLLDRIRGSSFAFRLSKTYGYRYHKYDGTKDTLHRSVPFREYCKLNELTSSYIADGPKLVSAQRPGSPAPRGNRGESAQRRCAASGAPLVGRRPTAPAVTTRPTLPWAATR